MPAILLTVMRHQINLLIFLTVFFCCQNAFSQQPAYVHPQTLGLHFSSNAFENKLLKNPGAGISYISGISPLFDFGFNSSIYFSAQGIKNIELPGKKLLFTIDANMRARMFSAPRFFQPYIFAGTGIENYNGKTAPYFFPGLGAEFNFSGLFLNINSSYRTVLSKDLQNHFVFTIGLSGIVNNKKGKKHNSGISLQPGKNNDAAFTDSDGDGIADGQDKCPTVPGIASLHGCPPEKIQEVETDSDGDGITDKLDLCPHLPGTPVYRGCPVPDTDQDGINDEMDSCIYKKGLKENNGCPVISKSIQDKFNLAASKIFFLSGSAELSQESFSVLEEIAAILILEDQLKLLIEGHTDNIGTREANQKLSEKRVKTVSEFLITKGIDPVRLAIKGYGEEKPVEPNASSEGRLKNRRVEFKVYY